MNHQSKRPTCGRCQRPAAYCLCAQIPCVFNHTPVLVLQHKDERKHALNTARLAVLGLENAELWVGDTFTELGPRIAQARSPYLLFPGEDARTPERLRADAIHHTQPIALLPDLLIVPDGTWRKARRILHANPSVTALPRLTLPEGLASNYRLRKASEPNALSTIEAIVHTLATLEPTQDFLPMLKPFGLLIDQHIAAMGPEVYARNYT